MDKITEPLIVRSMRRNPTGIVEYIPENGPKTGTTTRGFLAEYDEAVGVPTDLGDFTISMRLVDERLADAFEYRHLTCGAVLLLTQFVSLSTLERLRSEHVCGVSRG